MGSGGDDHLVSKRSTKPIRAYLGDHALLARVTRYESAKQDRTVTYAMIIHEALKPWYEADAARQREAK